MASGIDILMTPVVLVTLILVVYIYIYICWLILFEEESLENKQMEFRKPSVKKCKMHHS